MRFNLKRVQEREFEHEGLREEGDKNEYERLIEWIKETMEKELIRRESRIEYDCD
jgi:hypothetical protein